MPCPKHKMQESELETTPNMAEGCPNHGYRDCLDCRTGVFANGGSQSDVTYQPKIEIGNETDEYTVEPDNIVTIPSPMATTPVNTEPQTFSLIRSRESNWHWSLKLDS